MVNFKPLSLIFVSTLLIMGCSKENNSQSSSTSNASVKKITPEDDPNLKGTPVLGFKLRDSTFDSVKSNLYNYQENGESYAGGPILENDGRGFNIDGLVFTQFGFDKNNKLVYVAMTINENDHMSKETYHKVVNYVAQNNYKVIGEKAPFVGDRETIFETPNNELITVSSPHLGGFKVNVEYLTKEFSAQRAEYKQQSQQQKSESEGANF